MSEENKIVEPLYYNGYISLDERAEIREYIKNLQQRIDKAIEYIRKNRIVNTIFQNDEDELLSILKGEDK